MMNRQSVSLRVMVVALMLLVAGALTGCGSSEPEATTPTAVPGAPAAGTPAATSDPKMP